MSISAWILERLFTLSGASKPTSPKRFYKALRKNAIVYKRGEGRKACLCGVKVESGVYCGMRYYVFVPKQVDATTSVLYLHGSGYIHSHRAVQERMAATIAKNTHLKVYFPIYPKLPVSTALPCHAVLNNFCTFLLKKGGVLPVGDSSGASLCLALTAERRELTTAVAISPWLDLRLGAEEEEMRLKDKMLCPDRLRYVARLWAYDLPYEDVRLSPINGDYSGKKVWVFVGSKEILCPAARRFSERNRAGNVEVIVGEGMQHVYPLMPTPEGKQARSRICDIISEAVYKRGSR
ncbi:MAG: alpha/beta hydrolase [Clostridia bacterium]|nr:alpha/beta hydrolase [Clostridia bacterium]